MHVSYPAVFSDKGIQTTEDTKAASLPAELQHFQPTSDMITRLDALRPGAACGLLDVPVDALERIASQLFEISPTSIASVYLTSKRFHNNVSIRAGMLALQCRSIRKSRSAESNIPLLIIDEKTNACTLLPAAARMLPIMELSRMLIGHDKEIVEQYHYRLWDLAELLKPLARSQVLQMFIEAAPHFAVESMPVWLEDCHDAIRDEGLPERPRLYESFATALGFSSVGEIRSRFKDVLQDVTSLPKSEQALPLACLVRPSTHLPEDEKNQFFTLATSRIEPQSNQKSIRVLSAAMHYARAFSAEQHQVLEKSALEAIPALYDQAVMKEFMLDRAFFISAMHVDHRLEAFVSTIDLLEANRSFMTRNKAVDQREWQYAIFAPLIMCHIALPQNVDSYHAIKRVARYLPLRFEGAIAQETFGDQLSRRGADVNMIVRDMFARCKEMYLRKLRVDVF